MKHLSLDKNIEDLSTSIRFLEKTIDFFISGPMLDNDNKTVENVRDETTLADFLNNGPDKVASLVERIENCTKKLHEITGK